jgi:hypothetical protein
VLVAHTCNPRYSGGRDQKDQLEANPRQIVHKTLSQNYSRQNRAGGVAQVVDGLPSNCEALSSNLSAKIIIIK